MWSVSLRYGWEGDGNERCVVGDGREMRDRRLEISGRCEIGEGSTELRVSVWLVHRDGGQVCGISNKEAAFAATLTLKETKGYFIKRGKGLAT